MKKSKNNVKNIYINVMVDILIFTSPIDKGRAATRSIAVTRHRAISYDTWDIYDRK